MLSELLARIRSNPAKLLQIFTPDGVRKGVSLVRGYKKHKAMEAEKARRLAEFKSEAWRHAQGFSQRTTMGSYAEHVVRQASKLDGMIKAGAAKRDPRTAELFRRRFELVVLPAKAKILCLAARLGDEVDAWRQLGHPDAIGIDINPGPANPYVIIGDFHDLQFADASVDCVYCNSLDHAFDLDEIAGEVRRVLKPGGLFVLDIVYGYAEKDGGGYQVGPLDTTHWPTARGFGEVMAGKCAFEIEAIRDLAAHGSPQWVQCLLRKR